MRQKEGKPSCKRLFAFGQLGRQLGQLSVILLLILSNPALAQESDCEEVPFTLGVEGIGRMELFSLLCNEEVYISVPDLFDFLKIRNISSNNYSSIEGYLLHQNDTFVIDAKKMELMYGGRTTHLEERDLKRTTTNLYLRSDLFGPIFQLEISSNIRSMSVDIAPNFELPSLKLARREKLRENLRKLNSGAIEADSSLSKERAWFRLGVADWDLNLIQRKKGENYSRFNLGFGGSLAGGEFSSRLNYSTTDQFHSHNQFYRWQYVNNGNRALRQIGLGKIRSRSISTLYRPVVGVQLTNAPTYLKRSFGTYELRDYTEPNWLVELYINGVLVDFKQADAAGFFSFDVPLMYGSTDLNLRYYGPYGEEQIVERTFDIPFVFMPKNEFEYSLNAGIVEDGENNFFAQARMNYGLTGRISLGGGVEYLSSLEQHPIIPFLHTAVRLPKNMLFSAEYAHNVGIKADFSYTSSSNLRVELKYAKYEEEQKAVLFSFLEEREILLSTPFRIGNLRGNSRMAIRQNILKNSSYINPEWFFSTRAYGMNINLTTNAFFREDRDPWVYSRLSSSILLPQQITFIPQVDYDYNRNSLSAFQGQFRKRIFRSGYFRTSYGYNFNFDQFSFNVGLSFNLGVSRFSVSSTTSRRETSFTETASGSLLFGPSLDLVSLSDRTSMDRAHVKFIPFLDINGNNVQDSDEPQLQGIEVTTGSGRKKEQAIDGSTFFHGLEPYMDHHFILNTDHLDRIAWRVENKRLNIYLAPNQTRLVEIPVKVVGEVGGYILDTVANGIGGIRVEILGKNQQVVKQVISESDGFFNFLGLESGVYSVQIDSEQLAMLKMESNGPFNFEIRNTTEGDIVDNIEFLISETESLKNTAAESSPNEGKKPLIAENETNGNKESAEGSDLQLMKPGEGNEWMRIDTIGAVPAGATEGLVYKVQFLTTKVALPERDPRFNGIRHVITERTTQGYRYLWGQTRIPREAASLQEELRRSGFPDAFVVHYFNGERISVEEAVRIRGKSSKEKKNSPVVLTKESEGLKDMASNQKQDVLNFRIQLAASKVQLESSDFRFKGIEGVEEYRHEGMYKYTVGNFRSFGEANQFKNVLREQGITDAFVVPFRDNRRMGRGQVRGYIYFRDSSVKGIGGIPLEIIGESGSTVSTLLSEADGSFVTPDLKPGVYGLRLNEEELDNIGMMTENPEVVIEIDEDGRLQNHPIEFYLEVKNEEMLQSSTDDNNEGLVFRVQVLASVPELPVTHSLLKGLKGVEKYKHGGFFKYTIGESTKLQEIRQVRDDVLKQGFEDAFIVSFLNGVRINLQEMSGQVVLTSGGQQQGIEPININIFTQEGKQVTDLFSGPEGRFSFIGMKPGNYIAQLDTVQLRSLGLRTKQSTLEFEIQRNTEGRIKDPVKFQLQKISEDLIKADKEADSIEYRIQLAASNVPLGPNHPTLKGIENVSMYRHNGMYKYTVGSTYSLQEARELLKELSTSHEFSMFIVGFLGDKRILVLD